MRYAKATPAGNQGIWTVETGNPRGDIFCPHWHAVDMINKRDYSLNESEDTAKVTRADLVQWLADNRSHLVDFCYGHADCSDCGAAAGERCLTDCSTYWTYLH